MNGKIKIDFNDHKSRRVLTKCCLHNDFNLEVDLPKDRLCPTLPLRLNYIHFIEDLLIHCEIIENIVGIDIGTGSSSIYCLLAVRTNNTWRMIGLENEKKNVQAARENIKRNQLENQIVVIDQEESKLIFKRLFEVDAESKSFCLCNPPFYSSEHEMVETENRTGKRKRLQVEQPSKETVVEGGELAFVTKILDESIDLKDKVQIYSTMLGFKRNYEKFLELFKERSIDNFTTTKFIQGKVQRWGVAWSFCKDLKSFKDYLSKNSEKSSNVLKYVIENKEVGDVVNKIKEIFSSLNIEMEVIEEQENLFKWNLKAKLNTWSNQRRKRRFEKRNEEMPLSSAQSEQDLHMGFEMFNDDDKIIIKMWFISGTMSKDCVNQILQLIKNKINGH